MLSRRFIARSLATLAWVLAVPGCFESASESEGTDTDTDTDTGGSWQPDENKGPLPPDLSDGLYDQEIPLVFLFHEGEWVSGWDLGSSNDTPNLARATVSQVFVMCRESEYETCPMTSPAGAPLFPALPKDDDYSPYWQVHKVRVPDDYQDNAIKSSATLEASGFEVEALPMAVNCPLHRTSGTLEGNGADGTQPIPDKMAWVDGWSVYYWDFAATLGLLPVTGDQVSPSVLWFSFRAGETLPEVEPVKMMDLNGDGDTWDSNNVLENATLEGGYNQAFSVSHAEIDAAVTLAVDAEDPQASEIRSAAELEEARTANLATVLQTEVETRNFVLRL